MKRAHISMISLLAVVAVVSVILLWGVIWNGDESGQNDVIPGHEDLTFVVDVERDVYARGETVGVSSWFYNSGSDPVTVATYTSSCMLEVMVFNVSQEIVYDGTWAICFEVFVGDFVAEPGVQSAFAEWEWDMHYQIVEIGPGGEPVISRTDEMVSPGRYLVVGKAINTSFVDGDWLTIV